MAQVSRSSVLESFKDCDVYYSTDGVTYTVFSGYAASIDQSGGERASGEVYTFDGDTAIIGEGKRAPIEVTVNLVYTEIGTDPFWIVRERYVAGTSLWLRWIPKGSAAGNWQWTTDEGVIINCPAPVQEASSGDPVLATLTVRTAYYSKTSVAS